MERPLKPLHQGFLPKLNAVESVRFVFVVFPGHAHNIHHPGNQAVHRLVTNDLERHFNRYNRNLNSLNCCLMLVTDVSMSVTVIKHIFTSYGHFKNFTWSPFCHEKITI